MKLVFAALTIYLLGLSPQNSPNSVVSTQLLKTNTTWNGVPLVYSAAKNPEVQSVIVEIAPNAATAWHKHPVNNFAYVLAGQLRLELEDKTTHEFKAGEAFAEVVHTFHRGVNVGASPLKILVFYTGETGVPISIPRPEPAYGRQRPPK